MIDALEGPETGAKGEERADCFGGEAVDEKAVIAKQVRLQAVENPEEAELNDQSEAENGDRRDQYEGQSPWQAARRSEEEEARGNRQNAQQ